MKREFHFSARIAKAFVDDQGNHRLEAIASDNAIDQHRERFSIKGLLSMVEGAKTGDVFLVRGWIKAVAKKDGWMN